MDRNLGKPTSTSYISPLCLVKKAHESGLKFWMGIISDPAKAESLFKHNVDAIFTDYPQLMTMANEREISVFPIPFNEFVTIRLLNPENVKEVFIIDINGKQNQEFIRPFPETLIWRPNNNITKGLYLVYVITDERIIFEKILYY